MGKPRIIGISNQKGGVGKTTTSQNVAACLAKSGYKTLMLDLDQQGNLTEAYLEKPPRNTIFTLLMEECSLEDVVVKVEKNLLLIPCNKTFANFEKQFSTVPDSQHVLSDFIKEIVNEHIPNLDYIVMDCPPALGLVSLNVFVAAKEVYVPMEAQKFSLTGLKEVVTIIDKLKKRTNPDLELKGVFFTKHNPRTLISRNIKEFMNSAYSNYMMETHIRKNVALEECPSLNQSVFDYDPESNGAKDYKKLTEEIINGYNHEQN